MCNDITQVNNIINKDNIVIFHTNIRSIRKNLDQLDISINQFDNKPKLIIGTEAWLNEDNIEQQQFEGYDLYYTIDCINKSDGVVVYADKNLKHSTKIVNIGSIKAIQTTVFEEIKKFVITSIYRSHKIKKEEFINNLNKYLKTLNDSEHYFIGDINIDLLDPDSWAELYLNNLFEKKYLPLIKTITRPITHEKGTCIDHIFCNIYNEDIKTIVCKQMISDHYSTILLLDHKKFSVKKNNEFKFIDYKRLNCLASKINWLLLINENNDLSIKNIVNAIKQLISKSTKNYHNKRKYKKRSNWITFGLAKSCGIKNRVE